LLASDFFQTGVLIAGILSSSE